MFDGHWGLMLPNRTAVTQTWLGRDDESSLAWRCQGTGPTGLETEGGAVVGTGLETRPFAACAKEISEAGPFKE